MVCGWALIGAGHCGLQLARALAVGGGGAVAVVEPNAARRRIARRHLPGVTVASGLAQIPAVDTWLISIPDNELHPWPEQAVIEAVALPRIALHTSGLHPSDVLAPLARRGAAVGSFHPLVSFPTAGRSAVILDGAWAAIEGDAPALHAARAFARRLRMHSFLIDPAGKARYHAAASLAANLTYVLIVTARGLWATAGVPEEPASRAMEPLVLGAVRHALRARGMEDLTGPLARRDAAALRAHLAALPPGIAAAYAAVSLVALQALLDDGAVTGPTARTIEKALTVPSHCVSVRSRKHFGSH